jgi:hypothetical protein
MKNEKIKEKKKKKKYNKLMKEDKTKIIDI